MASRFRYTRRGLLRSGAAAGVLAATGMPVTARARRGGRLRLGLGGAWAGDTWDSRGYYDTFMIVAAIGCVFDTLTEVAADGSLRGELAVTWEASPDARVWTFDLRRGVRFHNGKPFGAEDVIASLALHRDPHTPSPAQPIVQTIEAMKAVTPHRVQFTLAAGNADFPYLLSDYHLPIYPAGQIAEAMARGIGTGLYRVQKFEPGRRFLGTRVADHYKDGAAGWFDEVEIRAVQGAGERARWLGAGKVDAVAGLDAAAVAALRRNSRADVFKVDGNRHLTFPMRAGGAPFSDPALRRAMKHAIDRPALLQAVLGGHGIVGRDSPIGPANPYFHAGLPAVPYDPDRARHHLRRAGVERLRIDLSLSDDAVPGAADAAEAFRVSAAAAGIDIVPRQEPASGYWAETWRQRPICACDWAGRATEDWMFATAYQTGAPWNDTGWHHPRFQALLAAGRSELDSIRRAQIYAEMQEILQSDGATIVPLFASFVGAKTADLAHSGVIGNALPLDNARAPERWWMA